MCVCVSLSLSPCACVRISLLCVRLFVRFRLVAETFGSKQVCGVFVWAQDNNNAPDLLQEDATAIFLAEKSMKGKGTCSIAFTTEQQQQQQQPLV